MKDCEYCHPDADGYVKPIEENGHAFIYLGLFGRMWLYISFKGDSRACDINYCPMCGRRLSE